MKCKFCENNCIKAGKQSNGVQKWHCKKCWKYQLAHYTNKAYKSNINSSIIALLKEGCGIRSIGRLLKISTQTISSRIMKMSRETKRPHILIGKEYEMDEIKTFMERKTKHIWVAYAIQKDTREVVAFVVGRRTKRTLSRVIESLKLTRPKRIFTDKLNIYKSLIEEKIHSTKNRGTNYIERNHLTIRTHLKRLNRRTICFSRNIAMLIACLRIYFWS